MKTDSPPMQTSIEVKWASNLHCDFRVHSCFPSRRRSTTTIPLLPPIRICSAEGTGSSSNRRAISRISSVEMVPAPSVKLNPLRTMSGISSHVPPLCTQSPLHPSLVSEKHWRTRAAHFPDDSWWKSPSSPPPPSPPPPSPPLSSPSPTGYYEGTNWNVGGGAPTDATNQTACYELVMSSQTCSDLTHYSWNSQNNGCGCSWGGTFVAHSTVYTTPFP